MTTNQDGAMNDETRLDRDPPSFPSVDDSPSKAAIAPASSAPLFTSPGAVAVGAEKSAVTSRPLDPTPSKGGGRLRWLVAGAATLIVILVVGGVLFLAAPRAGAASATAHYVPADTGMYAEFRLDLPGDQHDALAAFMNHFPGFADQAAFQQKLDESLNSVLNNKTNGAVDWNNDVKPWFGGQVAVFGNPSTTQFGSGASPNYPAGPPDPEGVVAFTVSDKTKLQSVIDANLGNSLVNGLNYQGVEIETVAQPGGTSRSFSYVITDDALLVSPDIDLLKQALDVRAGQNPTLADDTFFTQQLAALHADRLATVYFDGSKHLAAMPLPSDMPLPASCTQIANTMVGVKYVGEVTAQNDHLAFTVRSQFPSGDGAPPAPSNKQTTLAQAMPADTMAYFETRNAGANLDLLIKNLLDCAQTGPSQAGPLPSGLGGLGDTSQLFVQFLGAKPDQYLDFIDDAAVGVTYANDKVGGGIVVTVDDQAVATQRVSKLLALIKMLGSFGGQSAGAQISTEEIDHKGTKVSVIHVVSPDAGSSPLTLQVAVADGRLYLGLDDFVTSALDRSTSDSLASSARYQKAIASAPADNAGIIYVDVAAAANAYESNVPADKKQDFDANKKPFIDPLSSFSLVSHVDGGIMVRNGFLFVE